MPPYRPGDAVKVVVRFPLGYYRVPLYLRGKTGTVERLVTPAIDNEEEVLDAMPETSGTIIASPFQ